MPAVTRWIIAGHSRMCGRETAFWWELQGTGSFPRAREREITFDAFGQGGRFVPAFAGEGFVAFAVLLGLGVRTARTHPDDQHQFRTRFRRRDLSKHGRHERAQPDGPSPGTMSTRPERKIDHRAGAFAANRPSRTTAGRVRFGQVGIVPGAVCSIDRPMGRQPKADGRSQIGCPGRFGSSPPL